MAIADNFTPVRQLGNGTTDEFSGSWAVLNADYIRVYLENVSTGALTAQAVTTDYALEFDDDGFTVTFVTPPSSSYYAFITREVEIDQTDPFKTSKGFQGEVIENSLDKLTAISQDLRYDLDNLGDASADAAAAAASAIAAAASAAAMLGTSTTSLLISTGTKVLTTQTGKSFNNAYVFVASAANPANYFSGTAVYSGTTLTVTVPTGGTGGSGTFADWVISVSGVQGPAGAAGAAGAGAGDMLKNENLSGLVNYTTARANMGLEIGVNIQAYDATLTALGGVLTAANKIPYATALNTAGELNFSVDGTLAGNSDTTIPSEKAIKTYVDAHAGGASAATQSDQETATSTTTYVSPGRQQYHPGHPKFWGRFAGSGTTITSSFNVTSIANTGVGLYTITIATDFSNANWAPFATAKVLAGGGVGDFVLPNVEVGSAIAAGTVKINLLNVKSGSDAHALVDTQFYVHGLGDQ